MLLYTQEFSMKTINSLITRFLNIADIATFPNKETRKKYIGWVWNNKNAIQIYSCNPSELKNQICNRLQTTKNIKYKDCKLFVSFEIINDT